MDFSMNTGNNTLVHLLLYLLVLFFILSQGGCKNTFYWLNKGLNEHKLLFSFFGASLFSWQTWQDSYGSETNLIVFPSIEILFL